MISGALLRTIQLKKTKNMVDSQVQKCNYVAYCFENSRPRVVNEGRKEVVPDTPLTWIKSATV